MKTRTRQRRLPRSRPCGWVTAAFCHPAPANWELTQALLKGGDLSCSLSALPAEKKRQDHDQRDYNAHDKNAAGRTDFRGGVRRCHDESLRRCKRRCRDQRGCGRLFEICKRQRHYEKEGEADGNAEASNDFHQPNCIMRQNAQTDPRMYFFAFWLYNPRVIFGDLYWDEFFLYRMQNGLVLQPKVDFCASKPYTNVSFLPSPNPVGWGGGVCRMEGVTVHEWRQRIRECTAQIRAFVVEICGWLGLAKPI